MDNIVELNDPRTIFEVMVALQKADENGHRIRFRTGTDNRGVTFLQYALGPGMWTLPIYDEA